MHCIVFENKRLFIYYFFVKNVFFLILIFTFVYFICIDMYFVYSVHFKFQGILEKYYKIIVNL